MKSEQSKITGHPDYQGENKRLKSTIQAMEEAVPDLENAGFQVNVWDTEVDVRSKQMVAAYKRKKAQSLSENLGNPYFGRVDYLEEGLYSPEQLYVGRVGFNGLEEVQVVDWRAPKATVFYECQGGRANYTVRNETYYGEVTLKRQYQINAGELENFFDDQVLNTLTAELPGDALDEVLRKRLEQGTDNRLKDIVETIRSEQNQVIREPLEQVTIIQGTAGSGKSTVALHRVSYLLYNYQSLDAPRVLVIAPNKLFIDYISAALPGLDLEEVKQFTLFDLAESVLNCSLSLIKDEDEGEGGVKGSVEIKSGVEKLVEKCYSRFVADMRDIILYKGRLVISREELLKKFQEGNNPFNRRLDSLKKYLEFRINYFLETSDMYFNQKLPPGLSKSLIKGYVQRIRDNYEQQMFKAGEGLSRAEKLVRNKELRQKLQEELSVLEAEKVAFLQKLEVELPYMDIWQAYSEVLGASKIVKSPIISGQKQITYNIYRADLAPLCLLKHHLDGFAAKYQHIVVDEAQDLSQLEFTALKLLSRNSFTILGDLAQGISATEGLEDWEVLREEVFAGLPLKFHELKQSYRSTREIVEFANKVIPPGLPRGVPVYRRGEAPGVEKSSGPSDTTQRTVEKVKYYLEKGCKSVAVLGKTSEEAQEIFNLLEQVNALPGLNLITEKSTSLPGGITVLSIAQAKGLEFDAVIVWDASAVKFTTLPLDAKQLFVALSRPLHFLHVFYTGELTPLLV
jgi:DNA helicase II / ATP-dependent DNA helicase PcrA